MFTLLVGGVALVDPESTRLGEKLHAWLSTETTGSLAAVPARPATAPEAPPPSVEARIADAIGQGAGPVPAETILAEIATASLPEPAPALFSPAPVEGASPSPEVPATAALPFAAPGPATRPDTPSPAPTRNEAAAVEPPARPATASSREAEAQEARPAVEKSGKSVRRRAARSRTAGGRSKVRRERSAEAGGRRR